MHRILFQSRTHQFRNCGHFICTHVLSLLISVLGHNPNVAAQVNGPASAANPPWLFQAGGSLTTTYTDNVLVADVSRESDLIGTATAVANLRGEGRRGSINATANLSFDSYAHKSNLNSERYNGLIASDVDIIEDMFRVRANAATQLQSTSDSGAQPASERSIGQNQAQVLTYLVNPELHTRVGDGFEIRANYNLSGTGYLSPPAGPNAAQASDTLTQVGVLTLTSGPSFTSLSWTLTGSIEKTKRLNTPANVQNTGSSDRRNAEAVIQYRMSQALALTATSGYDEINEPTLNQDTEDAYARVGFVWVPSSRTNINLEGGYRYRGPNFQADITYAPREWLQLRATFQESIETQQRLVARQLGGVVRDDLGNLVDPITGLNPNVTQVPFDISDQAFRRNSAQLSLSGVFGRNNYSLTGQYETRDVDETRSDQWSAQAALGRQLSPHLAADVSFQYAKVEPRTATLGQGQSETISGLANLEYQLGPTVYASLQYIYQQRQSTIVDNYENVVVLSLTRRF
ncbi:MAG: TIGR03016 family PEP-CTERM system-associated outer membrane protein [Rhodobacteraceae bacterium]|nr:TIGR03016 family PEP-CTERM system-associated outer membrane protein [Paracoccaceae bacterium]